jgi:hypothetical protein
MSDERIVEDAFQKWYAQHAAERGLNPNPDDPQHFYDYRAAFLSGAAPDESGHWPSKFKTEGHPRMVLDGINTKTGKPALTSSVLSPQAVPFDERQLGLRSALLDSVKGIPEQFKANALSAPQAVWDYLKQDVPKMANDPLRTASNAATKAYAVNLPAIPMDTAAGIMDLRRAGSNITAGLLDLPPQYLAQGTPNEKIPGTSEHLTNLAREHGAGPYIDQPPNTSSLLYGGVNPAALPALFATQTIGGKGAALAAGIPKSEAGLFGGVQSKTDLPKLREALALSKQKVDMDTIRDKTGWFRDPGGQWQHEFAPGGGKFDWKTEFNRQDQEWSDKAEHLDQARWVAEHMKQGLTPEQAAQKFTDNFKRSITKDALELGKKMPASDLEAWQELHQMREPKFTKFSTTLEKVYQNDELFKRYPELKELAFNFSSPEELGGATGQYSLFGIDMLHQKNFPQEMARTMEHEIQHAIQEREKWARGGNPDDFHFGAIGDKAIQIRSNLSHELTETLRKSYDAKSFDERTKLQQKANAIKESISQFTPQGIYRRLLGEAQSRTAERHLNMSPVAIKQERLKDMYDVKDAPLLLKYD